MSGGSHWGGGIASRSGYYAWLERAPSERAQRDAELTGQIEEIHEGSRRTYGVPRIYAELKDQGQSVGGSGTASARWH